MARPNLYIFGDPETEQHRLLLQAQLLREHLVEQAPRFVTTNPQRILDLGCGVGHLSLALHEIYPEAAIVGIDRSPESLAIARTQPGLEGHATFVAGDIQEALPSGPFDLVYASVVMCHIQDLAAVVNLVYATLAPGGIFWIKDTHPRAPERATQPDHKYLVEHFFTAMQKAGAHPRMGEEVPALLTAAGFTDIRVLEDEVYPMGGDTLEGESMLADWVVGARTARVMLTRMTGSPEEEILGHAESLAAAAQASPQAISSVPMINILARRPLAAT